MPKVTISGKRTMTGDLRGAGVTTPDTTVASKGVVNAEDKGIVRAGSFDTAAPAPPFPDEDVRRKNMKHMLVVALGVVLTLALVAGGVFAFVRWRSADPETLLGTALAGFFESTAFAYNGKVVADLAITGLTPERETGKVKFTVAGSGTLASGKTGFGDGTHKLFFDGGWQFGTSTFGTNVESDVIVIGNDFYFNLLSIPSESDLDRELLRSNWVKMNFAELAREFQLSGSAPGEEEYGSFGGTTGDTSLRALLENALFFVVAGAAQTEEVAGVSLERTPVRVDATRFAELIRTGYRKYFNRNFTLTEEEALRFTGALEKVSGTVWTNQETGALVKIALSAEFDDDIGAMHMTGPVSFEMSFADFNKPPLFGTPAPVLTLSELRVKMEESEQFKGARREDTVRLNRLTILVEALGVYKKEKGRYPKELTELYDANKLSESSLPLSALKEYFYRSYVSSGDLSKKGACLTTGKTCAFYHLGTNLLDSSSPALQSDADKTTAVLGADKAGCSGEAKTYCYDVVSPP